MILPAPAPRRNAACPLSAAGSVIAGLLGALALAGWVFKVEALKSAYPGWTAMKANTALAFVLAALALELIRKRLGRSRPPFVAQVAASVVVVIGALSLIENLTGWNCGIDQLLFEDRDALQTARPGLMAATTALNFVLTGAALLILPHRSPQARTRLRWTALLAASGIAISIVTAFGYAARIVGSQLLGSVTAMAMPTAVAFAALGTGLLLIAWHEERPATGVAPSWLPAIVAVGMLSASLVLWQSLQNHEYRVSHELVVTQSAAIQKLVAVQVLERIQALERMARRWEFSGPPSQAAWEDDATAYLGSYDGFQAVEWMDATGRIRWAVPRTGNEVVINQNLNGNARRRAAVEKARSGHCAALSGMVELAQGGRGVLLYVPLYPRGEFEGCLVGVMRPHDLLDAMLREVIPAGYAVVIEEGNDELFARDTERPGQRPIDAVVAALPVAGNAWTVSVWPTPALRQAQASPLPMAALFGGLVVSLLLALTVHRTLIARRAERELQRVTAFQKEILDSANCGIVSTAPSGIVTTFNPTAAHWLGYTAEEVVGRATPQLWHDSAALAARAAALSTELGRSIAPGMEVFYAKARLGLPNEFECIYRRKDGSNFPVQLSVTALRDTAGGIIGFMGVFFDVTARKRIEAEAKAAQAELQAVSRLQRAVLDGTVLSVISTRPDGIIASFNAGAERMLGYSREEMIGRCTPEIIHSAREIADRAAELTAQLGQAVAPDFHAIAAHARSGLADEREWTYVRKDGSSLPVWLSVTTLYDDSGKISGFLGIAQDLTERKQADQALRASEERLRHVLSHADCLVWEARVQLTDTAESWQVTVYPSGLYHELFGDRKPAFANGPWDRFEVPERAEMHRRSHRALAGGETGYVQFFRLQLGDKTMWIRESVSIARPQPGQCWLVGIATDVTQQKRVEIQVQDAYRQLERQQFAVDQHAIVAVTDVQGTITYANDRFCAISGYSREELIGQNHRLLQSGMHPREFFHQLYATIARGEVWRGEIRNRAKDGHHYWVDTTVVPFLNATGHPTQYFAMRTDITKRKLAEESLQQSLALVQATLQSTADGILVIDRAGRIAGFNQRFAELWQMPPAISTAADDTLVIHHVLLQLHHPEVFVACIEELAAHPSRDSFDMLDLRDGRIFERYSRPQLVAGEALGRVWSFRDVTPQRRAEAEQKKLLAELERSNQELEQFAYVASHDLQEPLRMVASYTQLLSRRYKGRLDQDADEFIEFAVDGANRMQQLIHDLLSYSRVGMRGQPSGPTSSQAALDQALANLTFAIEDAKATILTTGELPDVVADASQLVQLFQNLVGNAIKFHRPAETPQVEISARLEEGMWTFAVSDNGIGIAPEYHERVFVIFQRLHGRDEYAGTGIGLAVCKRIVERAGGRIWIESTPGVGTTFRFTLCPVPIATPAEAVNLQS